MNKIENLKEILRIVTMENVENDRDESFEEQFEELLKNNKEALINIIEDLYEEEVISEKECRDFTKCVKNN